MLDIYKKNTIIKKLSLNDSKIKDTKVCWNTKLTSLFVTYLKLFTIDFASIFHIGAGTIGTSLSYVMLYLPRICGAAVSLKTEPIELRGRSYTQYLKGDRNALPL